MGESMNSKPDRGQDVRKEDAEQRPVSRSQRKRDSLALQELGEELARLSPQVQDKLPISDDLRAALAEFRKLASREGKRRQLQYLGRLMREQESPEAIADAMEALRHAVPRRPGPQ